MLVQPNIDPVAFQIGPLAVHWYGIAYLIGFLALYILGRYRIGKGKAAPGITHEMLDDLLFFGVLGVIIGGRLGHVLFYELGHYVAEPLQIFAVWKGGMSFHGGFLGVLIAMIWVARKHKLRWFTVMDFIAPLTPIGLGAVRIGNFINGELWGRVAPETLPWAMVFRNAGPEPRHPSQLYEAGLEGLILFLILWLYSTKPRPSGAVSAVFLMGYGVFRFVAEYFREPDAGIFGHSYVISMGQWLSLPMIAAGVIMLAWALKKPSTS